MKMPPGIFEEIGDIDIEVEASGTHLNREGDRSYTDLLLAYRIQTLNVLAIHTIYFC